MSRRLASWGRSCGVIPLKHGLARSARPPLGSRSPCRRRWPSVVAVVRKRLSTPERSNGRGLRRCRRTSAARRPPQGRMHATEPCDCHLVRDDHQNAGPAPSGKQRRGIAKLTSLALRLADERSEGRLLLHSQAGKRQSRCLHRAAPRRCPYRCDAQRPKSLPQHPSGSAHIPRKSPAQGRARSCQGWRRQTPEHDRATVTGSRSSRKPLKAVSTWSRASGPLTLPRGRRSSPRAGAPLERDRVSEPGSRSRGRASLLASLFTGSAGLQARSPCRGGGGHLPAREPLVRRMGERAGGPHSQ